MVKKFIIYKSLIMEEWWLCPPGQSQYGSRCYRTWRECVDVLSSYDGYSMYQMREAIEYDLRHNLTGWTTAVGTGNV